MRQRSVKVYGVAAALMAILSCHDERTSGTSPVPAVPTVSSSAAPPTVSSSRPQADATVFVPQRIVDNDGRAMGTHLAFTAFTTPTNDEAKVRSAFSAATEEIRRLEAMMTTWRPDSELSRVNDAAGISPVPVGQETYDVVAASLHTSEISEGTFDITFESLHGLWKFDQDLDPHPPTEAQVKAKLPLLNFHHVHLDAAKHSIYLDQKGVRIGLGGIAKGYAVDHAAKVLQDAGLASFFVQAGGDLYTRGKKPDGTDWSAGVRDPRGPEGSYFAVLAVTDHAFSTAGDYERSYVVNDRRYHHIIDPRTGYPATASRSVTIWAKTALEADELDDAVFILGPEKGLALVESQDGVGAVIVDAHNKVWVSKRLEGKLHVLREPTDAL
jgi:thiamine biosynthesis lipoprotein